MSSSVSFSAHGFDEEGDVAMFLQAKSCLFIFFRSPTVLVWVKFPPNSSAAGLLPHADRQVWAPLLSSRQQKAVNKKDIQLTEMWEMVCHGVLRL